MTQPSFIHIIAYLTHIIKILNRFLDESIEASKEGNRFKAHGIAIDAEKVAKEFEDLVYSIEDGDIEEFVQAADIAHVTERDYD